MQTKTKENLIMLLFLIMFTNIDSLKFHNNDSIAQLALDESEVFQNKKVKANKIDESYELINQHIEKKNLRTNNFKKQRNNYENFIKKINSISLLQTSFGIKSNLDERFYVTNIKCDILNCNNGSFCMNDSICKCGFGKAHLPSSTNQNHFCGYQQKYQTKAFLFHLFVGLGSGHLYSERSLCGIVQLALGMLPLLFYIYSSVLYKLSNKNSISWIRKIFTYISLLVFTLYITWWLVDLIKFANNSINDGNDIPLVEW